VKQGVASRLNRRITIERPTTATGFRGAGKGGWQKVGDVYAEVQDALPSRAERLDAGINVAQRPARVRMRYREDITPAMRFVMGARVMQIVSGPAEIGRRELIEFMTVEYTSAGNPA
jgi:SPP1 family predicted phage head-tail adaptor